MDFYCCILEYNVGLYGEMFHCERDNQAIPKSMLCIYSVDASGYMTGCKSGDHLQHCGNENYHFNHIKSLFEYPQRIFVIYTDT